MEATLCNPVLLRLITAYQYGWWYDSLVFRDDPLIFASSNLQEEVAAFGDRFAPWLARRGLDGAVGLMQLYPPLAPCIALHAAATDAVLLRLAAAATSRNTTSWIELRSNVAAYQGDHFECVGTRMVLQSGRVDAVLQLCKERGLWEVQRFIRAVAADGHLPIIRFLVEETTVVWPHDAYDIAMGFGHKDVATYFAERGIGRVTSLQLSATKSPLERVQLLRAHFPNMDLKNLLEAAAIQGHDDVVAYILATGTSSLWALELAAKHGHLDCCQRLLAQERALHPHTTFPVSVIVAAVAGGNDAIIELLHPLQLWPHEYMDTCAQFGRLDLVTSLHNAGCFTCSKAAMDLAATNGHLAVVQFLKYHRNEGCTAGAINRAAAQGHVDVVVFLHEHCDGEVSRQALADAAIGGHVAVVRYLHSVLHMPVLDKLPERAAYRGHLEVVRYLHEERLGLWSYRVMDAAAASGNCDLVAFLHTHRREGCSFVAMDSAIAQGHLEVVRYLYDVVGRTPSSPSTLQNGSLNVLLYLDSIGVDVLDALSGNHPRRFVALAEYLMHQKARRVPSRQVNDTAASSEPKGSRLLDALTPYASI